MKACTAGWQANKDDNQAKGISEKAYVAQCRGDDAAPAATPAATPSVAPAATPAAPKPATTMAAPKAAPTMAAPAPTPGTAAGKPAAVAATAPTGANQFAMEGQAKARCPSDTVVWANLSSKVYHFTGYKNYGNTKSGANMCEKDATAQGFRASKSEKHPA